MNKIANDQLTEEAQLELLYNDNYRSVFRLSTQVNCSGVRAGIGF